MSSQLQVIITLFLDKRKRKTDKDYDKIMQDAMIKRGFEAQKTGAPEIDNENGPKEVYRSTLMFGGEGGGKKPTVDNLSGYFQNKSDQNDTYTESEIEK